MQAKGHIIEDKFAELETPIIDIEIKFAATEEHGLVDWKDEILTWTTSITLRPHYKKRVQLYTDYYLDEKLVVVGKNGMVKPEDALPGADIDAFFSTIYEILDLFPDYFVLRHTGKTLDKLKALIPGAEDVAVTYVNKTLTANHVELTDLWESTPAGEKYALSVEISRFVTRTRQDRSAERYRIEREEKEKRQRIA